jgi:hypothetical protein
VLEVPQSSGTYTYAATLSEVLAGMDRRLATIAWFYKYAGLVNRAPAPGA